jgi:hypothetical protein
MRRKQLWLAVVFLTVVLTIHYRRFHFNLQASYVADEAVHHESPVGDVSKPSSEVANVDSPITPTPSPTPTKQKAGIPKPTIIASPSKLPRSSDSAVGKVKQQQQQQAPPDDLSTAVTFLKRADLMIDLSDDHLVQNCDWPEKESGSNVKFMKEFGRIFREKFNNLPWFLDEGGLIGSGRAGAMANADDDFDFFAILPNQSAPCRPGTPQCTLEEFEPYIHRFLLVFWNEGMCINKFHPDPKKFKSKGRLMYSFQLNRPANVDPLQCFHEKTPFAHMHLGMLGTDGLLHTNIWVPKESTHSRDSLPLNIMLPVTRCRAGPVDAPCPQNITGFLSIRNEGEYRKRSSDGSCLLVRSKWGLERKKQQVDKVRKLHQCGYNTMVDLADAFVASGFKDC